MLTHSHIHSANKKTADSISGFRQNQRLCTIFLTPIKWSKNNQIITKK